MEVSTAEDGASEGPFHLFDKWIELSGGREQVGMATPGKRGERTLRRFCSDAKKSHSRQEDVLQSGRVHMQDS